MNLTVIDVSRNDLECAHKVIKFTIQIADIKAFTFFYADISHYCSNSNHFVTVARNPKDACISLYGYVLFHQKIIWHYKEIWYEY